HRAHPAARSLLAPRRRLPGRQAAQRGDPRRRGAHRPPGDGPAPAEGDERHGADYHLMADGFRPAAGLSSPHAQTIFASYLRPRHTPPLVRQRLETPDGDFVDADRLLADRRAPHLLILHGLEGSSKSGYVRAMLRGAAARGWGAGALNFR